MIIRNNLILLSTIFFSCISIPYNSSLLDLKQTNTITSNRIKNILIRDVNILNIPDEKDEIKNNLNFTIKSNIKNLIQNNVDKDIRVKYYNNYEDKNNSLILDFYFKKYDNRLEVHPYYFPFSILTLTLYIWFGGPVIRMDYQMEVEMKCFYKNKEVYNKIHKLRYKENENIYDRFKARRRISGIRSNFILLSFTEALNEIK